MKTANFSIGLFALILVGCASNKVITLQKGDPSILTFDPVVSSIKQECGLVETEAGTFE